MASVAAITAPISASLYCRPSYSADFPSWNGVGTAIRKASASSGREETVRLPDLIAFSTTSRSPGSWIWIPPRLNVSTTSGFTSTPTTWIPCAAKVEAVGSPM